MSEKVRIIVKRFRKGEWFHSEYEVPFKRGMTLLEALQWIKENLDRTLAFRANCRMGLCGSCGLTANGEPVLACETQVSSLGEEIELEPLRNFPPIRDLVVDFTPFLEKQREVKPHLIREGKEDWSREYFQSKEELDSYIQFTYCISCGLCYSACPTSSLRDWLGPQALMTAYRFSADSRDSGFRERLEAVKDHLGFCHLANSCSEVCPKGVDPSLGIQLLRRKANRFSLLGDRKRKPRGLVPPREKGEPIPYPEPTVEGAEEEISRLLNSSTIKRRLGNNWPKRELSPD